MTLIDTHAHLDLPEFSSDREQVIDRARAGGVETILTVGIGMRENRAALGLARKHAGVYAALGLHPHNARQLGPAALDWIEHNAADPRVVALGEMGLDFYRNLSPRDDQLRCFRAQLELARSVHLPIIIHDRDAHRETLDILQEERAGDIGGVIHCFSGDAAMACACIDLGFFISIPGTVTFKGAVTLHEVVRQVPLEHMLIETDCPFLAPVPYRGTRNEPAYVKFVAEAIAAIKKIPPEDAAAITLHNAERLFWPDRAVRI
jgi:TatD DNase family protein